MDPVRVLPFLTASGPEQMARDEALLHSAADRQIASLRFYHWTEPTLSLGYFQPADSRLIAVPQSSLPWVRRASGGAAILHHAPHELTYSFALPADRKWQPSEGNAICWFHGIIRDWLLERGIAARLVVCGEEKKLGDGLCFLHHTAGDLTLLGSKVVGSAQRKLRGATLQHGTILLTKSPYTPQLPGIEDLVGYSISQPELMDDVVQHFAKSVSASVVEGDWTEEELRFASQIEVEKYRSREWNERR